MNESWPVSLRFWVLGVSVSAYFEHRRRQEPRRPSQPGSGRLSDEAWPAKKRAIHAEVRQKSGRPKRTKPRTCAPGAAPLIGKGLPVDQFGQLTKFVTPLPQVDPSRAEQAMGARRLLRLRTH